MAFVNKRKDTALKNLKKVVKRASVQIEQRNGGDSMEELLRLDLREGRLTAQADYGPACC